MQSRCALAHIGNCEAHVKGLQKCAPTANIVVVVVGNIIVVVVGAGDVLDNA